MNENAKYIHELIEFTCVSRFQRCIVIAHKKIQLAYFVWILVPKRLLLRLVCIFWRVDASMSRKSCHTCCD